MDDGAIRAMARRFCIGVPNTEVEVDDAAQELRLAWLLAERAGHPGPIALKFALGHLRRGQLFRRRLTASEPMAPWTWRKTEEPDPYARDSARRVQAAIPEVQWRALIGLASGMTGREVADELGLSRKQTRTLVGRARQAAAQVLEA